MSEHGIIRGSFRARAAHSFHLADRCATPFQTCSPHRTMNPDEADLFFVPLYTSCFRSIRVSVAARRLKDREGILRGRGSSVEEDQFHFLFSALDYLKDVQPYWNRQVCMARTTSRLQRGGTRRGTCAYVYDCTRHVHTHTCPGLPNMQQMFTHTRPRGMMIAEEANAAFSPPYNTHTCGVVLAVHPHHLNYLPYLPALFVSCWCVL